MLSFQFSRVSEDPTDGPPELICTPEVSDGDIARLAFVGDVDADTVREFSAAVLHLLRTSGRPRLQIDLSGVGHLAAAGVQALLRCREEAVGQGCLLTVHHARPTVRYVLRVTEVLDLLENGR